MSRRKEERYQRAMARLSTEKEDATRARVLKAVQESKNKNIPEGFIDRYTDHKLGKRKPKT